MNLNQQDLAKALSELQSSYPDLRGNNKMSIGGSKLQIITEQTYKRESRKRSRFQNLIYEQCDFYNNAFTASAFHNVCFKNVGLLGNSFANCNFFDCEFSNQTLDLKPYEGNNFSQSNFTACSFTESTLEGSGFLQTLFYNSDFINTTFRSCTLEGSCFNDCRFTNVNIAHTNIEFIELLHTELENVIFPFYQFAYIIGASEFLTDESNISFKTDEKEITRQEFLGQIDNLILYYLDEQEYFPACNLLITKGDRNNAQSILLNGINQALDALDFRMVRHFCRLAKRHDLFDEVTIRRATREIENHLLNDAIPPERLNDFIVNAGEIRKILLSGKSDSVTYNVNIQTNACKNDPAGVQYVTELSNDISRALAQYDYGQLGFQVAVSNHSPFEIIVDVICATDALVSIASLVWSIVEKKRSDAQSADTIRISNDYMLEDKKIYEKYVESRIETCKQQLLDLNAKNKKKNKKMDKYIKQITQQLKTDIVELYSKDVMIFKKSNSKEEQSLEDS